MHRTGILYALASAALFGISAPLAKNAAGGNIALAAGGPALLGSGLGLALARPFSRATRRSCSAAISRGSVPRSSAAVSSAPCC